ncbi:MAG TPA: hypothetical protein VMM18_14880 [Gemmatimonadaceae bacterium]|nr:hypothetical protein [Gemmatimonadaceae bacterium]
MITRLVALGALVLTVAACASTSGSGGEVAAQARADTAFFTLDSTHAQFVPAGFGSLRQDDIAIKLGLTGVQVRVLPLDETVLRLLAADSYRALHDLVENRRDELLTTARRYNLRNPSLWYVSFYGVQQDARFDPAELIISTSSRQLRPIDFIPLTSGFGERRLQQRETQSAIIIMEEIDISQPVLVEMQGVRNNSWESTLRAIERERALVRSRASGERAPSQDG